MGQALYRKYRSKSLSEIVGQDHITKTLGQALKQGRVRHAYLFTGPRGVGKTSVARIWAQEINGLPYVDDTSHIDIIEIDAASNRRIDEIRELREKVHVAPVTLKYKVYIIDEVHMLTREAFNALLKTLEEPPEHVVFILATTDVHKLPDTIISRTQRFNFKPVDVADVTKQLKHIAKSEKISISDDALELLAERGEGSFRDSISLLDQVSSTSDKVEVDDIRQLVGIAPHESIAQLIDAVNTGDASTLINLLHGIYDQGYQASSIAKQIGKTLREHVIKGENVDLDLLGQLLEVPVSHNPERFLELVLLQAQPKNNHSPVTKKSEPTIEDSPQEIDEKPAAPTPQATTVNKPSRQLPINDKLWTNVLKELKQRHNTLYGVVRMAQPDFSEEGKLKLTFNFAFHQKRIKENSNQQMLAAVIQDLTGKNLEIECLLDKAAEPPHTPSIHTEQPKENNLTAISNIFGEAELLES